eukprot:CAMPEP_0185264552 /NCGR_PEP_ID=MMETSP1359-20130426/23873_1 /TAXON_ID=552665 /ORGANISM="Bigelowiella longifila, Strain CCMP242" /LENGTH=78 /DNA_ID=CAMNT_0027853233 /DNA_START=157 /DNA_END=389 /DNA_ORIENTATION=+
MAVVVIIEPRPSVTSVISALALVISGRGCVCILAAAASQIIIVPSATTSPPSPVILGIAAVIIVLIPVPSRSMSAAAA